MGAGQARAKRREPESSAKRTTRNCVNYVTHAQERTNSHARSRTGRHTHTHTQAVSNYPYRPSGRSAGHVSAHQMALRPVRSFRLRFPGIITYRAGTFLAYAKSRWNISCLGAAQQSRCANRDTRASTAGICLFFFLPPTVMPSYCVYIWTQGRLCSKERECNCF